MGFENTTPIELLFFFICLNGKVSWSIHINSSGWNFSRYFGWYQSCRRIRSIEFNNVYLEIVSELSLSFSFIFFVLLIRKTGIENEFGKARQTIIKTIRLGCKTAISLFWKSSNPFSCFEFSCRKCRRTQWSFEHYQSIRSTCWKYVK